MLVRVTQLCDRFHSHTTQEAELQKLARKPELRVITAITRRH